MSDPRYLQSGRDAQASHVVEEIGETVGPFGDLLAALGKTGRWGWDSTNPEMPVHMRETNRDWVRRALAAAKPEVADLLQAIERLETTLDGEGAPDVQP